MQHTKSLVLTAQVFISLMMAAAMTLIMGYVQAGPQPDWLAHWGWSFLRAWPIAFVLSLAVGPLAFRLAVLVHRCRT
ncbi:DUF2798 domain-containing protein [Pseudooceanicola sp. 502str34]|uniref:DUF2798 domain-containing protein n=1 Tax=Maritimibacter alkaliphilus TaxID=404236 RepID=UPI001C96A1F6|nr:DUF2798 domain-containing protein [Maritimibacter alkaliphilus]MBY6091265.1 DUF2798 domain-containing protein [Maritimibacter alkaliphilus]